MLLWPPYAIGQAIIFFAMCFLLSFYFFFFFSLILSRPRLDVCHTSTYDVALVTVNIESKEELSSHTSTFLVVKNDAKIFR